MKLGIKIGDKVEVIKGKFAGQKSTIAKIDKRTKRIVLEDLKKQKVKTKKNETKELHGSFHFLSLKVIRPEKPKVEEEPKQAEAPKTEGDAAKAEPVKAEAKEETKVEAKENKKEEKKEEPKKEAKAEEKKEETKEDKAKEIGTGEKLKKK